MPREPRGSEPIEGPRHFHTVSGERFSPSPIGYRYGDGVGEAGEKVEGNTRVHGRNSMNWYRLAAHFVPRSRSCGSLVKRSDPFLPPPLSLLVVDSHHSRAFFSLLSFSPAGGREPSHEGSGSRRGFFSLLSLSPSFRTTKRTEKAGRARDASRLCPTFTEALTLAGVA